MGEKRKKILTTKIYGWKAAAGISWQAKIVSCFGDKACQGVAQTLAPSSFRNASSFFFFRVKSAFLRGKSAEGHFPLIGPAFSPPSCERGNARAEPSQGRPAQRREAL